MHDARSFVRRFVRSSVRSFVGSPPPTDASLARARVMAPNPPPDPFVLRGHATDVQCVSFDARFGARALETGDADGVVITWDTRTRREISRARAHAPTAGAIAMRDIVVRDVSDDDDSASTSRAVRVTQGKDGSLKFWRRGDGDVGTREAASTSEIPTRAMRTDVNGFCRVASDGGDLLAFAMDSRGTIAVRRASSGTLACAAPPAGSDSDANDPRVGVAMCAAFVRSEHVFVGYEDGTVILWWLNLETGVAELAWRRRTHGETTLCVDVDAEGVGAVTGGADGVLVRYVINIDAREPSKATVDVVRTHGPYSSVTSASSRQPGASACAIRGDGKIVACGCWDGKIRVFEYKVKSRGRLLAVLKYHDATVTDVLFAPDGSFLASAARDGAVALWNVFPPSKT